jgi:hypothetical protein
MVVGSGGEAARLGARGGDYKDLVAALEIAIERNQISCPSGDQQGEPVLRARIEVRWRTFGRRGRTGGPRPDASR